jgi:F0F1-type ATP synthase assembly protein I
MANSDDERDGRSATARRVTSIGLQMALPPALGWWADSKFKTAPWMLCVGAVVGFVVSLYQLIRLAAESEDRDPKG